MCVHTCVRMHVCTYQWFVPWHDWEVAMPRAASANWRAEGDHPETAHPGCQLLHMEHVGCDAVTCLIFSSQAWHVPSLIFPTGSRIPSSGWDTVRDCSHRGVWPQGKHSWTCPAYNDSSYSTLLSHSEHARIGDVSSWLTNLANFISTYPPSGVLFILITSEALFQTPRKNQATFLGLKNIPNCLPEI